jgi:hypothetical protein
MKKTILLLCFFFCVYFNTVQGQSLDFEHATYYTALGNTLTSSGQTLASFNYNTALATHPIFNDGIYYPQVDFLNHNFWVRVRHIADDPNGIAVGHNVTKTSSSPFRSTGFGGWWGFLYDFEVYKDANLTGNASNTLNGLYPLNITVESIETLSYPEWVSFELLNPESSDWVLNSKTFTGTNPGSNPGFSAVNIPYSQTGNFSSTFPASSKNIYAIDKGGSSYAEFRMSASNVSHFTYGYEYDQAGGYQGFRLKFGSQSIGLPSNKPGSGTNLHFNGTSNLVDLGNSFNDENFTVDMWVKPGATQANTAATIISNSRIAETIWAIEQNGNTVNQYYFYINGTITGNFSLVANKWQHIAVSKSATNILIYINGMLVSTTPWSGVVDYANAFLKLGAWGGGGRYWNGSMDEVRVWNTALSQAEIRDRLCRKLISSDPLYNNLKAYYNFDEGSGITVVDSKSKTSIEFTGPTWETSGAPIGNFSAHNYSGGTSAAALVHPTRGDALTATLTTGKADGVHVYNVTEKPNTANGVTGVGDNDSYFGVFVVNGTNAAYNAEYNFTNVFLNNNKNDFHLFKRADNAATIWTDCNAIRDVNANKLTINGEHTEYMLGSIGEALPITGLLLQLIKQTNSVELKWQTVTEINSRHFEVQRSKNGSQFEKIATLQTAGNSNTKKHYNFMDVKPLNGLAYYRIKQIDIDGKFVYSAVHLVKFTEKSSLIFYPNPVKKGESLQLLLRNVFAYKTELINMAGQVVYSYSKRLTGSIVIPISTSLERGQYILKVAMANKTETHKILIR